MLLERPAPARGGRFRILAHETAGSQAAVLGNISTEQLAATAKPRQTQQVGRRVVFE